MQDQTIVEQRPVFENKENNSDNGDDKGKGKNNRTILIAVVAAIILCCCCLLAAVGGPFVAGNFFYTRYSPTSVSPTADTNQLPDSAATPFDSGIGDPPSGGLGNDVLKNDTWNVMAPAAVGLGCDRPVGADSTIEVIQQPDENGVWIEHWAVACESGDTYLFEVEYILDDTGATFNITPLQ